MIVRMSFEISVAAIKYILDIQFCAVVFQIENHDEVIFESFHHILGLVARLSRITGKNSFTFADWL